MFTHKGQMASNVKDPTTSTKDKVTSCQFSWVLLFRPVHSFFHWKYEEVTCNTAITAWTGNGKSFIWRIYGAKMSKAFAGHSSILIDNTAIRFNNGNGLSASLFSKIKREDRKNTVRKLQLYFRLTWGLPECSQETPSPRSPVLFLPVLIFGQRSFSAKMISSRPSPLDASIEPIRDW